jgi:tripartite-type tricarboxylate transporter receptor subunit TctC
MATSAGVVCAQTYPNKPIRMVTSAAGGSADFAARLIAQGLTGDLGQQVVVDNRGGSVSTSVAIVAKAPPDGYTLLLYASSLWIAPLLQQVSYDPIKDFSPITLAASSPYILVVHPTVPVTSVKELIALAKAKPGELNYGSSGLGTANHLAAELFNAMAGVSIVHVPYKGAGPALNALIGGQLQVMFPSAGSVTSHIKSGRLKALGVTSAGPSALAPGLPTVAAAGVPGYESLLMIGVFTPAGVPAAIINRLNQEIVKALRKADTKERLFNAGVEAVGGTPAQLAASVKSEMVRLGKVIKDAGIRAE